MNTKLLLVIASVVTLFGIGSFRPAAADTNHCGNITSNETWAKTGNVHIVTCNVIEASGVTLTI